MKTIEEILFFLHNIKDEIKKKAATNSNQQMALWPTPSSGLISHFANSYLKVFLDPSQSLFYFVPHSQAGSTRYSANSPFLSSCFSIHSNCQFTQSEDHYIGLTVGWLKLFRITNACGRYKHMIQELRLLMLIWISFCFKSIVNCFLCNVCWKEVFVSKLVDEEGGCKGFHWELSLPPPFDPE